MNYCRNYVSTTYVIAFFRRRYTTNAYSYNSANYCRNYVLITCVFAFSGGHITAVPGDTGIYLGYSVYIIYKSCCIRGWNGHFSILHFGYDFPALVLCDGMRMMGYMSTGEMQYTQKSMLAYMFIYKVYIFHVCFHDVFMFCLPYMLVPQAALEKSTAWSSAATAAAIAT